MLCFNCGDKTLDVRDSLKRRRELGKATVVCATHRDSNESVMVKLMEEASTQSKRVSLLTWRLRCTGGTTAAEGRVVVAKSRRILFIWFKQSLTQVRQSTLALLEESKARYGELSEYVKVLHKRIATMSEERQALENLWSQDVHIPSMIELHTTYTVGLRLAELAKLSLLARLRDALLNKQYGWKTTHFWGPITNWGIAAAGIYDIFNKGPDMISLPVTSALCMYSLMFMRFAIRVSPRNYLLYGFHSCNAVIQFYQLQRKLAYERNGQKIEIEPKAFVMPVAAAAAGAGLALFNPAIVPRMQSRLFSQWTGKAKELAMHPAGPFTVFFWSPWVKWGLSGSNIVDFNRPVEKVSAAQQASLALSGAIWARWSFVISPINYNLALVNFCLGSSAVYQLSRKFLA